MTIDLQIRIRQAIGCWEITIDNPLQPFVVCSNIETHDKACTLADALTERMCQAAKSFIVESAQRSWIHTALLDMLPSGIKHTVTKEGQIIMQWNDNAITFGIISCDIEKVVKTEDKLL